MQDEDFDSCVFILCRMSIIPYGKNKRCMHGNIKFICLDCEIPFAKGRKIASLCCHESKNRFAKIVEVPCFANMENRGDIVWNVMVLVSVNIQDNVLLVKNVVVPYFVFTENKNHFVENVEVLLFANTIEERDNVENVVVLHFAIMDLERQLV